MGLKSVARQSVNAVLHKFGMHLDRVQAGPQIGMEVCLRNLAARGYDPARVLDIGASRGWWTRLALYYWPRAEYFLIEPLVERNKDLDELKREHPNVRYLITAVGSSDCSRQFSYSLESLHGGSFYGADSTEQVRQLTITTLDALSSSGKFGQPGFIKIDTEGYELEILRGGVRTMRDADFVLLEASFFSRTPESPTVAEIIQWMTERDFILYEIADVLRHPKEGFMGLCDLLFLNARHPLASSTRWT